jgi:hypothetical protein
MSFDVYWSNKDAVILRGRKFTKNLNNMNTHSEKNY